jgi:hypothetical protein
MKKISALLVLALSLIACDAENVGPQPRPPLDSNGEELKNQWCTIWHGCGSTPDGGILTCCDNWCYTLPWCNPRDISCVFCDNDLQEDGQDISLTE